MDKINAGALPVLLAAVLSLALPRDAASAFIELSAVRPPPTVIGLPDIFEVNFVLTLEAGDSIARGDVLEFVFPPYLVRSERGVTAAIVDVRNFGLINLPEDRVETPGNPLAARRIFQDVPTLGGVAPPIGFAELVPSPLFPGLFEETDIAHFTARMDYTALATERYGYFNLNFGAVGGPFPEFPFFAFDLPTARILPFGRGEPRLLGRARNPDDLVFDPVELGFIVPEPAIGSLLGVGALCMLAYRRHRHRRW